MTTREQYQITPLEMAIVLMSMIIGVGILTIPRSLTAALETPDGWLAIGLTGIVVILIVYLIVRLQSYFPGQTLFDYLERGHFTKWVSHFLKTGFIIYFLTLLAFEARVLALVVNLYLLDRTPSVVLVGIILLTTTYGVTKGFQGIVHLSLLFLPITLILGFILLLANLPNVELERLLPIMGEGIAPIFQGIKEISLSYLGIEILFFLLMTMDKRHIKAMPYSIAITIITILYMATFIVVVSIFGVEGSQIITFPTVEAIKEIEVPGAFFERLESLMITIWLMTIFNTMAIAQLLTVQTVRNTFRIQNQTFILASTVFITFILAFIPSSIPSVFEMGDRLGWFGVCLITFSLLVGYLAIFFNKQPNKNKYTKGM